MFLSYNKKIHLKESLVLIGINRSFSKPKPIRGCRKKDNFFPSAVVSDPSFFILQPLNLISVLSFSKGRQRAQGGRRNGHKKYREKIEERNEEEGGERKFNFKVEKYIPTSHKGLCPSAQDKFASSLNKYKLICLFITFIYTAT